MERWRIEVARRWRLGDSYVLLTLGSNLTLNATATFL